MASTTIAQMRTRTDKAARILEAGGAAELAAQPGSFAVIDRQGSGRAHIATQDACTCRDFQYRRKACKHMIAARKLAGIEICDACGAYTTRESHYVGGRGYCTFAVCSADKAHKARRVE